MKYINNAVKTLLNQKDKLWLIFWLTGICLLIFWDLLFLNIPAFRQILTGFFNTLLISIFVILFSLILSWSTTILLQVCESRRYRSLTLLLTFMLNLIRSIPQIIGLLLGYILITSLITTGILQETMTIMLIVAFIISLFVFQELVDLMMERINYFKRSDFYNAMRLCGISEQRIINRDILWKNSWIHIFNKLISLFGITIFLLCSIDFILSVGLSTDASSSNLPVTLGSLLAKIDSKQDILAIGKTILDPSYIRALFLTHLQGISIAFLIVFTLLCTYKMANGFAKRYHL